MKRLFLFLLLAAPAMAQDCDKKLWDHVYHPQRLKVIASCVSVTGVIVDATHGRRKDGQRHEKDADNHGWLKLDKNLEHMLLPGNTEAEGGNLVFECVCTYNPPTQEDAKAACKGYKSKVKIPPPGTRVRMYIDLVEDLDHKPIHREGHPVYSIEVITTKN